MDDKKIKEVFDLIQDGQQQDGMNLLRQEFIKTPNDWRIQYYTGFAWRIIGDLDKAIISYQQAIQLCPDGNIENHLNYYGLGIAFQLKGDFQNALDCLRKAYEIDKKSVQVLNSLGLTYKKMGNIEKALEIYEYAAQTQMGNIFEELKHSGNEPLRDISTDNNEKIATINMDIFNLVPIKLRQDNLYCTLQNNIGICYAELGKIDEARNAFQESINFIPDGLDYQAPYVGLRQLENW